MQEKHLYEDYKADEMLRQERKKTKIFRQMR